MQANGFTLQAARDYEAQLLKLADPVRVLPPERLTRRKRGHGRGLGEERSRGGRRRASRRTPRAKRVAVEAWSESRGSRGVKLENDQRITTTRPCTMRPPWASRRK